MVLICVSPPPPQIFHDEKYTVDKFKLIEISMFFI